MYPKDRNYTRDHEWAMKNADNTITVGITNYAQEHLGDIVFLELPQIGSKLTKADKLGEVESVKSVSDIFSPVSGEVISINEAVIDNPEIVNQDPHANGWLVSMIPTDLMELDDLLNAEQYQTFINELD